MTRQQLRRTQFHQLLALMPMLETWETTHTVNVGTFREPELEEVTRHHVRSVPRHIRRDMARKRFQREWKAAR